MNTKRYGALAGALLLASLALAPLAAETQVLKQEAFASYYGDEFNGRPTSSGELFDMNAFTCAHKTLPFGTMLEVTNLANRKKVIVRVNDRGPFVEEREIDVSKAAAIALDMISSGIAKVSILIVDGLDAAAVAAVNAGTAPTTEATEPPAPASETAVEPATPVAASSAAPLPEPTLITPAEPKPVVEAATTVTPAPAAAATPVAPATPVAAAPTTATPATTAAAATPVAPATPAQVTATPPAPAPVAAPKPVATVAPISGPTWRIQLGSFLREENATRLVVKLRKAGFDPAFEKSGDMTRVVLAGVPDRDLASVKQKLGNAGFGDYLVKQETR